MFETSQVICLVIRLLSIFKRLRLKTEGRLVAGAVISNEIHDVQFDGHSFIRGYNFYVLIKSKEIQVRKKFSVVVVISNSVSVSISFHAWTTFVLRFINSYVHNTCSLSQIVHRVDRIAVSLMRFLPKYTIPSRSFVAIISIKDQRLIVIHDKFDYPVQSSRLNFKMFERFK